MVPKLPPRRGPIGFLFVPPYRVQGVSVAGEETVVQVPELDVCFDIGLCPRFALASPYVALSHAHMDHIGGLPYYFSQRMFQKMGPGTCVCHPAIAEPLSAMMRSWIDLEQQETQHRILPLESGSQIEVKNNIFLRAVEMSHTVPAMGYSLIERRTKLKEEFFNQPQERLRELKAKGVEITKTLEIPLIAYTGDTELAPGMFRDEFAAAQTVITECTFFDEDHHERASIGKHLHVRDLAKLLDIWQAKNIILVHLSRRTMLGSARQELVRTIGEEHASRVHFLMDHRTNRQRYEQQLAKAESKTAQIS